MTTTTNESVVGVGAGPREAGSIIIQPGHRAGLSWHAIFAGTLVAIGSWLALHTLAVGLGLTAIDPDDANSLRGAGIGTGIGALLVPLIALLLGGVVAGRVSGPLTRSGAVIHGAVVWALTTIVSTLLTLMLVNALVGTAGRAAGATASAAGSALSGADLGALGLSGDDLAAPINRRLAAEGKPTISGDEMQAAVQDAMRNAVREGRLDREMMARSIADNTDLTRADASDIADRVTARINSTAGEVGHQAMSAADTTGKLMLALFGSMLLSLGTAILGALLIAARHYQGVERRANPNYPSTSRVVTP
jgi:hypothetical protein